jgi:dTDP-4-amino-4,6-dideoxygalactose transaminase
MAFGFKKGSEVIVPDYTFPATALAVIMAGLKPVFVDVNERTYNIDIDLITREITDKTVAIIPVHLFGQMVDIQVITSLAKRFGLKVVEDAACALGARHFGFPAGKLGDVGCFSLHARKVLTTGEGGFITTDDKAIADYVRKASNFGIEDAHGRGAVPSFTEMGFNFKMSDLTAAIGVAQMRRLDSIIEERQKIANDWRRIIEAATWLRPDGGEFEIIPPVALANKRHAYQSFVCLLKNWNRDEAIKWFGTQGMETGIGTYACHRQPLFQKYIRKGATFPISDLLFDNAISLPMFQNLVVNNLGITGKGN